MDSLLSQTCKGLAVRPGKTHGTKHCLASFFQLFSSLFALLIGLIVISFTVKVCAILYDSDCLFVMALVSLLKKYLSAKDTMVPTYYYFGFRKEQGKHCRLRLAISNLNYDLFRRHLLEDPYMFMWIYSRNSRAFPTTLFPLQ